MRDEKAMWVTIILLIIRCFLAFDVLYGLWKSRDFLDLFADVFSYAGGAILGEMGLYTIRMRTFEIFQSTMSLLKVLQNLIFV